MKFIVCFSTLLLGALAFPSTQEFNLAWNTFKVTHAKTYSPLEEAQRISTFQANLKKIEEHNQLFDEGKVSYTMGVNQFADMTSEEFVAYLNLNKFVKPNNTEVFEASPELQAPASIDWRTKGAVTGVKNQGSCGSCWAFSTTGSLEGQNFLKNKKLVPLSEQELVDCSHEQPDQGCQGGFMDAGFQYVVKHGLTTEKDYPYEAKDLKCRRGNKASAVKEVSYVDIRSNDENALRDAVATVGPVSVAVDASNWQFYKSGVLRDLKCSSTQLNHGVLAVGYGNQDNQDYWLIKNSWGGAWGENGYIKSARNAHNNCGVAAASCYPKL